MKIFVVLLISILEGSKVGIFMPGLPDIQSTFNLTPFMSEFVLSANFISQCFVMLIVGNLIDKFGRRSVIVCSFVIFIFGSMICVIADGYKSLLIGRVLQGTGITAPSILSTIIIIDDYPVKKRQKLLGIINGVANIFMAIAPVIGSYVVLYFGWRFNFAILCCLGIIILTFALLFVKDKHVVKEKKNLSISIYWHILCSRRAITYILAFSFLVQGYMIFNGMSSILYQQDFGIKLQYCGFFYGSLSLVFSVISIASGFLIKFFGMRRCFLVSSMLIVLFEICIIIILVYKINNPIYITGTIILLSAGAVIPINAGIPMILSLIPEAKGKIYAMIGTIRLLMTSFGLQIAGYVYSNSFFSLGVIMFTCTAIALAIGLYLWNYDEKFRHNFGSENLH